MSKVTVFDFAGTYGPPGRMFTREKTPEELAQDEIDAVAGEIDSHKARARITRDEFLNRFKAITWDPAKQGFSNAHDAALASSSLPVKAAVLEVFGHSTINLLDEEKTIPSVRQLLQVTGMPDGAAILTEEEGDSILAVPDPS